MSLNIKIRINEFRVEGLFVIQGTLNSSGDKRRGTMVDGDYVTDRVLSTSDLVFFFS